MNGTRDFAGIGKSHFKEVLRFTVREPGPALKRIFSIEVRNLKKYDQNRD